MHRIRYKRTSNWRVGLTLDGIVMFHVANETFSSPEEVLKYAKEAHDLKFGPSGLIYIHEFFEGNAYRRHHFHTLAAANRFHKAQATAKASDLTKSQLIRKELNKQPA